MYPEILLLVLASLANIILGVIVFYRTYRRPFGWFFWLTMFFVAVWAIGDALLLTARHPASLRLAELLFYIGPMFIPVSVWYFGLTYPNHRLPKKVLWMGIPPLALGVVLIGHNPGVIIQGVIHTGRLNVPQVHNPGFLLYAAYFSVTFICSYIALYIATHREKEKLARLQLRYTFYGVIYASIPALLSNLSLPLYHHSQFIWLGPLFTTVFVVIIAVSIVQHRMFDIQLVIARSLAYLLSLVTVAAIYGFITFALARTVFHLHIALASQVFLALATGIAALAFNKLKRKFDRITNKLFYRDAYEPQELFDRLNRALVANYEFDKLLKSAALILTESFKSEYCLFGIKETGFRDMRIIGTSKREFELADIAAVRHITPHLHTLIVVTDDLPAEQNKLKGLLLKNEVAVLVRLVPSGSLAHEQEGLGYLVLGQKKSGNPYSLQDLRVLDTVANELIIAIQNSLHYEEIQNFNQTLQGRVHDATHQLQRSNAKLKALDETKDEFITMASHQLRTPLTSVKGYLSMVLEGDAGKLTAQQQQLLTQSYQSAQRMVFLISDLLNLSRLNTGKFVIEPSPVDLREVVKAELDQLRETAKSREVTLDYDDPAAFPRLMLDETKIHQVVMNFIDNAIYYTPPGGHITISLIETPTTVEYRVKDTGIGVPRAVQHRLFTKFYRADNARRARPDGTGLGLFMAKKVIAAQGGAIIFESQEGKGSTFGFRFSKSKLSVPMPASGSEPAVVAVKA